MDNKIYVSLIEDHIYQFGDLLRRLDIELADQYGRVRRAEQGALIAYELRTDGLWESVHYSFFPLLRLEQLTATGR